MDTEVSRPVALLGWGLIASGVAHFVLPNQFEAVIKPIFPERTRRQVFTNGCIETALGVGLSVPRARTIAAVATVGYLGFLATSVVRSR